jgi:threonine dehydrogenase-like Zn-dependent dehydrogenase
MKALQVTAPGAFVVLDIPMPEPGPGQVLLRVEAVTTCPQWDLHLKHNEPMFVGHQFRYPYPPGQPGHEASGVIAAVGPDVPDLAVGEWVSAWRDPGHDRPGCYAEYVVMQAANVIRVPPDLPAVATAPVELAMCVGASFLVLKAMDAVRGRRFGVMGLGPAGLIAVQMARAEGAREVLGFDYAPARRQLALALGADATYDPRDGLGAQFPIRPAETALDSGIDCVGARASVEWLMDRCGGALALFGVQREDYTYAPRHWRGLRLIGYPGHTRTAAEYAVDLLARGQLRLQPLVTHILPLERYGEGVELLERQEAIKVCFQPGGSSAPRV